MEKETKKENELSKEELLTKYRSILAVLKMKSKMRQLEKHHQLKQIKKGIARLLTQK